jgi:hypothetical protein
METVDRAPKICYIVEPRNAVSGKEKRIIAIAMTYNKESGEGKYAASIFRRVKATEKYKKSDIRKTAEERYKKSPVNFTIGSTEELKFPCVLSHIRKIMYHEGVKDKMVQDVEQ